MKKFTNDKVLLAADGLAADGRKKLYQGRVYNDFGGHTMLKNDVTIEIITADNTGNRGARLSVKFS